jgi:ribosomal protein S6
MEKEPELYEVGYLLKSGLEEGGILAFSENLRNTILEKRGLIVSEGKTKKQPLAYPIKKELSAIFNWIKFSVEAVSIKEIKKYLDKQTDILRFLIIKVQKEEPPKPTILKPRKAKIQKAPLAEPVKTGLLQKPIKTVEKEKIDESKDIDKTKIKEEEIDKKIEKLLEE